MNKPNNILSTRQRTIPAVKTKDWQSINSLAEALQHVARHGGKSPGPDGISIEQVKRNSAQWLKNLQAKLRKGAYIPGQPRICAIRKVNAPNEYRKLGIYNVEDRVVASALKNSLQPIIDCQLHDSAFAFRPKRSIAAVMRSVGTWVSKASLVNVNEITAVTIDIADCFNSIRHSQILDLLTNIADRATITVVEGFLPRSNRRSKQPKQQLSQGIGVVQGNPLSPLFCNIALTPFDKLMNREPCKSASFRYADDILLVSVNMAVATGALQTANETLTRQGFRLKAAKIRFNSLCEGVDWLGMRLRAYPSGHSGRSNIKVTISDSAIAIMKERIAELTDCPNDQSAVSSNRQAVAPQKSRQSVQAAIRAWLAGYSGAENVREVRVQLEQHAEHYWNKKHCHGKGMHRP